MLMCLGMVVCMQFTPCGKYLVVRADDVFQMNGPECTDDDEDYEILRQYDVATMSPVHVIPRAQYGSFAISPCSRVVVFGCLATNGIVTRHLYPYNSE